MKQSKKTKYISEGVHILVDLHNISNVKLNDIDYLESIMTYACELSGAKILNIYKHKFEPAGVTLLFSLSESHASIHTYVELNNEDGLGSGFLDFFTCGSGSPEIGVTYIVNQLCMDNEFAFVDIKTLKRGLRNGIVDLSEMY